MPAKNHLSQEQKEQLLKTLKEHENPYVREKILIILLMNDGKTYQEISNFLDIAYPTVAYWAVHGDPDNVESFLDGRREGNLGASQFGKNKRIQIIRDVYSRIIWGFNQVVLLTLAQIQN